MHTPALRNLLPAAALAGSLGLAGNAAATPIGPGFDLLSTPVGGTFIDGSLFGAGGEIELVSNPFGPGNTDTIVSRKDAPASGTIGTIPVEIVALSLIGTVTIGPDSYYVHLDINREIEDIPAAGGNDDGVCDPTEDCIPATDARPLSPDPSVLPRSLGVIEITTHDDTLGGGIGGGTFNSFFDVFAVITLVDISGVLAPQQFLDLNGIRIESTRSTWCHQPAPGYPADPRYPAGGFHPGVDCTSGAPVAGEVNHDEPYPTVVPSSVLVPAPTTLALLGISLGVLGIAAVRRRAAVV